MLISKKSNLKSNKKGLVIFFVILLLMSPFYSYSSNVQSAPSEHDPIEVATTNSEKALDTQSIVEPPFFEDYIKRVQDKVSNYINNVKLQTNEKLNTIKTKFYTQVENEQIYTLESYTIHTPISINGNDDFISQATSEGWIGSGTESDPYIIEGLNITPSGGERGITISNTNLFFTIQNCIINSGHDGINFNNVSNAQIVDSIINNTTTNGIGLYRSSNIFIYNCTILNSTVGILTLSNCENVEINSCTISNTTDNGVQIDSETRFVFATNNIFRNVLFGFHIMHNCYNLTLTKNYFSEIIFDDAILVDWGASWNITLSNNILFNNSRISIHDYESPSFNEISHNVLYGGSISLNGDYYKIENNTLLENNGVYGSLSINNGHSNIIRDNTIETWMEVNSVTHSLIENNSFIGENEEFSKLHLGSSSDLRILNNEFINITNMGIATYNSNSTIIENNLFSNVGLYGLHFPAPNFNITIRNNFFQEMHDRAIDVGGTHYIVEYNTVINSSTGFTLPSLNDSIITNNYFFGINNTAIGSYWSCTNLELSNNVITNARYGISLDDTVNVTLYNNSISDIYETGIVLSFTGEYKINTNEVDSVYISVDNNYVHNAYIGFSIWSSNFNSYIFRVFFFNNSISNIRHDGIAINDLNNGQSIVSFNRIDGCNWAGVQIWNTSNTIIENNIIQNCCKTGSDYRGVNIEKSNTITVKNNTLTANNYGVALWQSEHCTVSLNTIQLSSRTGLILGGDDQKTFDNVIKFNNFIDNLGEWGVQADDSGERNIFIFNYWSDHSNIDSDADGVADDPYTKIGGSSSNTDPYPLVTPIDGKDIPHILSNPEFTYPFGGIKVSGIITVKWKKAIDSFDLDITYDLYYTRQDSNTWVLIASDIHTTSHAWDTANVPDGKQYKLKIVAKNNQGMTSEDISGSFTISNEVDNTTPTGTYTGKETLDVTNGFTLLISLFSLCIILFLFKRRLFFKY